MQITLERKGGRDLIAGGYWRAVVQDGGYEATDESWTRRGATRRARRKLNKAADIRWTLAQAVNIEERAALARATEARYAEECAVYAAMKAKQSAGPSRKPRTKSKTAANA